MRRFVSLVLMSWFVVLLSACGAGDDGGSTDPAVTYPYLVERQHISITDTVSLLEWSDPAITMDYWNSDLPDYYDTYFKTMTRTEAIQYCDDLTLGAKTDWRLPNANEVYDAFNRGVFPIGWDATYDIYGDVLNVGFSGVAAHLADDLWKDLHYGQVGNTVWKIPTVRIDEYQIGAYDFTYENVITFEYETLAGVEAGISEGMGNVFCVRGDHAQQHSAASVGTWQDIVLHGWAGDKPTIVEIDADTYSGGITVIGDNEVSYTGLGWVDSCGIPGDCLEPVELENATLIRSGIDNVKFKGEFKAFANENVSLAKAKMNNPTAAKTGVAGVGDIDVVLGGAAYYLFSPATAQNPAGTTELAADGSGKLIVYCTVGDDGRLILDDFSPVTTPTGSTEVDVIDHEGNEATFTVEIIGEESDVGVLNVPEAAIPYNFKSTIEHGRDYIYYGYNDGETALSYSKELSICNIGTMDISGTTFTIDVDADDAALVRSFSHDYSGSATGFGAGACQTYTLSMAFNRPVQDDEVKINITITDNFNQTTWDDYTTFKLSQYTPLPLYFAADTNTLDPLSSSGLQGLLVAPGRQILRVVFTSFDSNNFIRVPRKLDDEYQVILATTNINDESTYMISTDQEPDITLMAAFTDVAINEPDNSYDQATVVPLLGGEAIGYLHKGDVDFYRLTETP